MRLPPSLPQEEKQRIRRLLSQAVSQNARKIVVLDDDPTGVQTVHGVSVYTDWSMESLRAGFLEPSKLFFVLTNSRAMTAAQTERTHREIAQNLTNIAAELNREFLLVSRSNSTLRGHYPLETEVLREGLEASLGRAVDGEILCPYFGEGGRVTIGNVHYVRSGDTLLPAADTEFAKDRTFGYTASDLREYVEEKTRGAYRAADVRSISLKELRAPDLDGITRKLLNMRGFKKLVVNAAEDADLQVFCVALHRALDAGRTFVCRTAASFVKAVAAIGDKPLLKYEDMICTPAAHGGIVMVGSHTQKTTEQLQALLSLSQVEAVELRSDLVLELGALERETQRVIARCDSLIEAGLTPVVFTNRTVLSLPGDTPETALSCSVRISDAVQAVVAGLGAPPAFIVAKGGITSSDIATKALHVKRAEVLGQIIPGVPVWRTGSGSRFPEIPYVIFPGNVGQANSLRDAAEILLRLQPKGRII